MSQIDIEQFSCALTFQEKTHRIYSPSSESDILTNSISSSSNIVSSNDPKHKPPLSSIDSLGSAVDDCFTKLLKKPGDLNPLSEICLVFARTNKCTNVVKCRRKHFILPSSVASSDIMERIFVKLIILLPLLSAWKTANIWLKLTKPLVDILEHHREFDAYFMNFVCGYFVPMLVNQFYEETTKNIKNVNFRINESKDQLRAALTSWDENCAAAFANEKHERIKRIAAAAPEIEIDLQTFVDAQMLDFSSFCIVRDSVQEKLLLALSPKWPAIKVTPFGSSINGFGGTSSDIDFVLQLDQQYIFDNEKDFFNEVITLCSAGGFSHLDTILNTRVPVVKMLHEETQMHVDLVLNNTLAIKNSVLLQQYSGFAKLRSVIYCVKKWAKCRGLSNPQNSTLTSYAWNILVIFFFQQIKAVPNLQADEEEVAQLFCEQPLFGSKYLQDQVLLEEASLTQLLASFFAYYSADTEHGFCFSKFVVSIRIGRKVLKSDSSTSEVAAHAEGYRFCIEDPYEPHDLGRVIRDPRGQLHIMRELQRACVIIEQGEVTAWEQLTEPCLDIPFIPFTCKACGSTEHSFKACSLNVERCLRCHQLGHFIKDCRIVSINKQRKEDFRQRASSQNKFTSRPSKNNNALIDSYKLTTTSCTDKSTLAGIDVKATHSGTQKQMKNVKFESENSTLKSYTATVGGKVGLKDGTVSMDVATEKAICDAKANYVSRKSRGKSNRIEVTSIDSGTNSITGTTQISNPTPVKQTDQKSATADAAQHDEYLSLVAPQLQMKRGRKKKLVIV